MNAPKYLLLLFALSLSSVVKAQITNADSATVAKTFANLLAICKYVDTADPDVQSKGTFYQAADWIVYRGDDKKRAWKELANYANAEEKAGVDEICTRINNTVNQDEQYRITGYHTETESEGTWYILQVRYTKKGVEQTSAFAFLKINGRFALGDID